MVCHIETIIVGVANKLQQLMLTLSNMEHKITLADFNLSVYYFSWINYSRQTRHSRNSELVDKHCMRQDKYCDNISVSTQLLC